MTTGARHAGRPFVSAEDEMPRYGTWLITDRQRTFIYELAKEIGMSLEALADEVDEEYQCTVDFLTRREASALIEDLLERKQTARR